MNLRFIVMITGYAESASTSCLIYQCGFFGNPGYKSYKEAITDLALDLYAKFYDEVLSSYQNRYDKNVKKCCLGSMIANKDAKFCAECGQPLANKKFDAEEFMQYIVGLNGTTADSYGDAEDTSDRNLTWWPYWAGDFIGAPKEEVIFMAESAEQILLAALLEAKPELKNASVDSFQLGFIFQEWEQFKNNIQPSYR